MAKTKKTKIEPEPVEPVYAVGTEESPLPYSPGVIATTKDVVIEHHRVPEHETVPSYLPASIEEPPYSDEQFFAHLPEGFSLPRKADYLGDVFFQMSAYHTAPEKVLWLRQNAGPALSYLLRVAFCEDVEWLIPKALPVYKAHKGRRYSAPSELRRELKRFYLFLRGGNDAISQQKRQKLFQEVIEGIEATELAVLVAVKDHTMRETFGVTANLVKIAFPGLLDSPFEAKFIK